MDDHRPAALVLAEWRAAERALEEAVDGPTDREAREARVAALAAEYRSILDAEEEAARTLAGQFGAPDLDPEASQA